MAMKTLAIALFTIVAQLYLAETVRRVINKGMDTEATVHKFGEISSLENFSTENGTEDRNLVKKLVEELNKTRAELTELKTANRQRDEAIVRAKAGTNDNVDIEEDGTSEASMDPPIVILTNMLGQLSNPRTETLRNALRTKGSQEGLEHAWYFKGDAFFAYIDAIAGESQNTEEPVMGDKRFTKEQEKALLEIIGHMKDVWSKYASRNAYGILHVYIEEKPTKGWTGVTWATRLKEDKASDFDAVADCGGGGKYKFVLTGRDKALEEPLANLSLEVKGKGDPNDEAVLRALNDKKVYFGFTGNGNMPARQQRAADASANLLELSGLDRLPDTWKLEPLAQEVEGSYEFSDAMRFMGLPSKSRDAVTVFSLGSSSSQMASYLGGKFFYGPLEMGGKSLLKKEGLEPYLAALKAMTNQHLASLEPK